jgi:hypothetical protein
MSTLFEPLNPVEKTAFRRSYLEHLKGRNGRPDRSRHIFERREQLFVDFARAPLRWQGPSPVSPEVFARNNELHTPEPDLDAATLWALAVAKINRSEQYGVERGFNGNRPGDPSEDIEVYIEIEEHYHTRLLAAVLETIGLQMQLRPPRAFTRLVIRAMISLPESLASIPILISERGASVSFWMLIEKARELFAAQPKVLARIEFLLSEIMVDEVGHLHYIRSRLGPRSLRIAEQMMGVVGGRLLKDLPELQRLFGHGPFLDKLLHVDIDAIAARYPGCLQIETALASAN